MAVDKMKRKLTTIFCADVQSYSSLMAGDEAETLARLQRYRSIMGDLFQRHEGRKVNTWGDAVIAEFASVVEAVRCAVEIQDAIGAENRDLPETGQMWFRIGINLGDVMQDGAISMATASTSRAAGIARRSRRHHGVGDGVQPDQPAPRLRLDFVGSTRSRAGRADPELPRQNAWTNEEHDTDGAGVAKASLSGQLSRARTPLLEMPVRSAQLWRPAVMVWTADAERARIDVHDRDVRNDQPADQWLLGDLVCLPFESPSLLPGRQKPRNRA